MVALQAPDLVRRMVLAGTGPRGGGGIGKMPFIVGGAYAKAFLTRKDPRHFLFFPRTAEGKKAANAYFDAARGAHRRTATSRSPGRPASPSCGHHRRRPARPRRPVGHQDPGLRRQRRPRPHGRQRALRRHGPPTSRRQADRIYPNSGHGGVFQHHQEFVPEVLAFLAD